MKVCVALILLLIPLVNGQTSDSETSDAHQTISPIPRISGLLEKMLRSAGFKSEVSTHQIAVNFTLTPNEMSKIAELTNITSFQQILDPILVPRIVGTKGHDEVEKYIKKALTDLNFNIDVDEFVDETPLGVKTFRNLIATFDLKSEKRLVLACHYDSKILEGEVFIGAIDSAVPCAMILDIAKTIEPFLKKQENPKTTLQLIFFDGEEAFENWTRTDSIYGSRHLANLWSQKKWGTKSEDTLNETNKLRKIDKIFNSFEILGPIEDDHMPFRSRRVPIMHLITFEFPPSWHTAKDNQKSLDMDTIFNLLSIIRVFVFGYLGLLVN